MNLPVIELMEIVDHVKCEHGKGKGAGSRRVLQSQYLHITGQICEDLIMFYVFCSMPVYTANM